MARQKTALGRVGWTRLSWVVALVFLFNPNMHGVDILPDAVGYLLLIHALRRVATLDDSFAEASRLLGRMAWLSAARLVGLVWIIAVPGANEQPTLLLLLSFVLGVLELITVFPACHQLFRGLAYLGSRMGGEVVLTSVRAERNRRILKALERPMSEGRRARLERKLKKPVGGDMTDRACLDCLIFAVVKTVLCVLPELSALSEPTYREGVTLVNWYAYVNLFRVAALAVGSVVGLVWLCRMARYLLRIEADTSLWETLEMRCDEDERNHPERLPARHLRLFVGLTFAAFVFCINFSVDNVNLFPSVLTPLILLGALSVLRQYLSRLTVWLCALCCAVSTAASGVAMAMSLSFFAKYDVSAYFRSETVQRAYDGVFVVTVIESVATALMLVLLFVVLWQMIARYTGHHDAATFCYTKEEIIRVRRRQLVGHTVPVLVLGILSAAAHPVYVYLLPEYDFVWLIDVGVALLFVFFAWMRLGDWREELDPHAMLDGRKVK